NVIRTYDLDKIDYANLTYDFTDTKLHNCAILVNASTDSYQTLPKLLATIEAKVTTGWNKEYKAAIQMDTVIEIPRENFYREVVERTGAYVYYDFTGENEAHAILTLDDVAYTYIGKVKNNHYIKADNDVCYVIKSIGYGSTGDVIKFESQQGTLTMDIAEAKAYTLNDIKAVLGVGTSISD
ncbi:MAG: hypothetical protein IJW82_05325, partial [Clostridia bacterium]|nr:hypothetical protein [Clostridia bacterium]